MNDWLEKMRQAQAKMGQPPKVQPSESVNPDLDRLRALFIAGRLKGMKLEMPTRLIPDVERYLARFYGPTLTEADRKDIEEIAAFVASLPFLELN